VGCLFRDTLRPQSRFCVMFGIASHCEYTYSHDSALTGHTDPVTLSHIGYAELHKYQISDRRHCDGNMRMSEMVCAKKRSKRSCCGMGDETRGETTTEHSLSSSYGTHTASDLERPTEKAKRRRRKMWSDLGRRRGSEIGGVDGVIGEGKKETDIKERQKEREREKEKDFGQRVPEQSVGFFSSKGMNFPVISFRSGMSLGHRFSVQVSFSLKRKKGE
jgi:hypothetical protein